MIREKLVYLSLLVTMVLFYILYRGHLSLELLIFVLLFPVPLWISVHRLKKSLDISIYHSREPILKGKIYQWVLQVDNQSIFSSPHSLLTLEYQNSLTGTQEELTLMVPVLPRNTQRLRLSFHAVTCGVMQIRIKKLVVFDPMRIFCRKIKLNLQDTIVIMPAPTALLPEIMPPIPQLDADSTEYAKTRAGDDPSEIFDLHEYREGDAVSRIHWKLSSKLDTLMVKEYSLPLSAGCLLIPDYRYAGEQPESALRLDTMLSALSAVAAQLSEQRLSFRIAMYHSEQGFSTSDTFTDAADAAQWLRYLVRTRPLEEADRAQYLQMLSDYLTSSHPFERCLVFTPQADDAMRDRLTAMPEPENFTVFTVLHAKGELLPQTANQLFHYVPVLLENPVHPVYRPMRREDEPDFDTEVLVKGGAEY